MSASAPGWTRGHRPPPDRAHRGHGNRRGGPAATPRGVTSLASARAGLQAGCVDTGGPPPAPCRPPHWLPVGRAWPGRGRLQVPALWAASADSPAGSSAMSWCWGESRQVGARSHRLPLGAGAGAPSSWAGWGAGREGGLTALGLDAGGMGPAARTGSEVAWGRGRGAHGAVWGLCRLATPSRGGVGSEGPRRQPLSMKRGQLSAFPWPQLPSSASRSGGGLWESGGAGVVTQLGEGLHRDPRGPAAQRCPR